MACAECGTATREPGEFHPQVFCALKRAYPGRDPWDVFRQTAGQLGIELPERAPLVRDLPVKAVRLRRTGEVVRA